MASTRVWDVLIIEVFQLWISSLEDAFWLHTLFCLNDVCREFDGLTKAIIIRRIRRLFISGIFFNHHTLSMLSPISLINILIRVEPCHPSIPFLYWLSPGSISKNAVMEPASKTIPTKRHGVKPPQFGLNLLFVRRNFTLYIFIYYISLYANLLVLNY